MATLALLCSFELLSCSAPSFLFLRRLRLLRLLFFFSVFSSLTDSISLFLTRYSTFGSLFLQTLFALVLDKLSSLVVVDLCLDWRETVLLAVTL